ncbi:galactose oxidase early set domain-containing protein [Streptomyces aidingensis]|uniref:Galactose oxidase-like Early set domain-containing protein n=1 Tax=Streptomyces aidingensis TaxID=910347 RepID=A0A1I1NXV1_9ACTN|nr:galactose oxidase early set domain-containing protein [Streptomyces aidingensis]SFD02367.1 protein of unknown function [Streptomyces aidingensis]
MVQRKLSRLAVACAVVSAVTASTLLAASGSALGHSAGGTDDSTAPSTLRTAGISEEEVAAEVDPEEAAVLGEEHAEEHAKIRIAAGEDADYPQTTRTASLNWLTQDQETKNAAFDPAEFGQFTDFFPSPDYGVHIAQLPTGKILVFSFEPVEDNPNRETAPTQVIGAENAGRAFLWDPERGTGEDAFTAVHPPEVNMPDGLDEPRPAPFFCAGHSFLPNGMLGVFGGNLGGNHGTGAMLALVFDPWEEVWLQQPDMSVGRWYPTVVTGPDGRQLIFSGQSERGWGTPTEIVERWPAKDYAVPIGTSFQPEEVPVDRFGADAPFSSDYPQAFALNDGLVYTLGRNSDEQWVFDPRAETRADLPDRPDHPEGRKHPERWYGSSVLLPNGTDGPEAILQMGGDPNDPATYLFKDGTWTVGEEKHFGRTQDDTLILPDGSLFTVNGAPDIRDYGKGEYNPNADQKYRQTELGDSSGENWELGPVQRLPRGYHSNAVVMPDGRIMITGDELQQIANDPDITDDMHGAIEIYEPAYLHRGDRPDLGDVPRQTIRYGRHFDVGTSTPDQVARAVVLAPSTSTHSINTSQRHLELEITARDGDSLELLAPHSPEDAIPGFYMLFLLDEDGVPSEAQWIQFGPPRR